MGTDAYSLTFWELMSRYLNNILLALLWAALTGSFTLVNFALGLLLGWLALYLVREQLGTRRGHFRGGRILSLAVLSSKKSFSRAGGWRVW